MRVSLKTFSVSKLCSGLIACSVLVLPNWLVAVSNDVKPNPDLFTDFEKRMDTLANRYGQEPKIALIEMEKIRPTRSETMHWASFQAYTCVLLLAEKRWDALDSVIKQIDMAAQSVTTIGQEHNVLLTAEEICRLQRTSDSVEQGKHIANAYYYVRGAYAPTLRYWVSTMYIDLVSKQGRAHDAIEAAKVALQISQANHDDFRTAVSLQSMAMAESDFGEYHDALKHIDESISILKRIGNTSYLLDFSLNRAYILFMLKRYDEAQNAYHEIEQLIPNLGNKGMQPIIWGNVADIAYMQGNYKLASEYVKKQVIGH